MKVDNIAAGEITSRSAIGEEDFWLVRRFLIDTWPLVEPFFNWENRRWDGSYFHNEQAGFDARWDGGKSVRLWFNRDGSLVAAVHPESKGQAWINIHPAYRHLEPEMLVWAEANLVHPGKDGVKRLGVFAWDYDEFRRGLLEQRGFTLTEAGDVCRRMDLTGGPLPVVQMPEGYRIHKLRPGHPEDCQRYAALLNAAFKRDFHKAKEIETFTTRSPSFRPEIEMIAAGPNDDFIALAGMIYDEDNRFGMFEPVCAHPGPKPLGLTGKLMLEGVRRVQALGAEYCYVGTGLGMAANRFYESVGFPVISTGHRWVKEF